MSQQAPAPSPVSKEALSALRHTIRAPLHQLISYAELITEEVPSGDVNHILSGIIARCESVLKIISNDPATENAERVVTALHDQLVDSGDEILRLAEQLQSMGERPPFFAERNDFSKLHLAAVSFRKIVQSLESEGSLLPPPVIPEGGGVSLALGGDRNARSNSSAAKRRMMHGSILIVDDNEGNRDVLSRRLLRDGCDVMLAEGGRQALRMAERYDFDIVLLDIMMPEMDGYTVLSKIKEHPKLRQLPVIMITAVDEIESVVRCIELGADDYLLKPFNPTLLRARINALLDRRRLREEEARHASELESALARVTAEQTKAKELLLNILPLSIAQELQENGVVEPMYFEDVTVAFADFVGFTLSTVELPAEDLVNVLHGYFTAFDRIMVRYMLEKLKTIGDCYMWAGGLPVRSPSHPVDMILAAFEMVHLTQELANNGPVDWQVRIGVNTGPVIAGVVGTHKFAFDIWGDTVNFSSRMESSGAAQRINISAQTFSRVKDFFQCEKRDKIVLKDGREVETYFVNGIASSFKTNKEQSPVKAFRQRYRTYFRKDLPTFPEWLAEQSSLPKGDVST